MLLKHTVERFGRQLLVPGVGVHGQSRLLASSVLIIGAGGLGSPAAIYLAAAGVGRLGIIDYDIVEMHNLHRQIMHRESSVGTSKVESARRTINELNSGTQVDTFNELFDKNNVDIVQDYDIVLDASDNAVTRYLVNDACVKYNKPLVSGAALRWEGHLTTLNYQGGPCYRCLFPLPPPPEAVTNCDAGGIMGPVTGCIGSLQAMEAIRMALGQPPAYAGQMLMYDGGIFRTIKLRDRKRDCVCNNPDSITFADSYEAFCKARADDKTPNLKLLQEKHRIAARDIPRDALIIDVRPKDQFDICAIRGSINVPLDDLESYVKSGKLDSNNIVVAVCRRGNSSQRAVEILHAVGIVHAVDVIGGIAEYARTVDPSMPVY